MRGRRARARRRSPSARTVASSGGAGRAKSRSSSSGGRASRGRACRAAPPAWARRRAARRRPGRSRRRRDARQAEHAASGRSGSRSGRSRSATSTTAGAARARGARGPGSPSARPGSAVPGEVERSRGGRRADALLGARAAGPRPRRRRTRTTASDGIGAGAAEQRGREPVDRRRAAARRGPLRGVDPAGEDQPLLRARGGDVEQPSLLRRLGRGDRRGDPLPAERRDRLAAGERQQPQADVAVLADQQPRRAPSAPVRPRSATQTTGNSSPLARWIVISRTASRPSDSSAASPSRASARSWPTA